MSELPEWIETRLDENLDRDLRQRQVVEVIYDAEEPYLSRTEIQQRASERADTTFDKSTVIDRLTELVEQRVLKSDEVCGGLIYWIYDERSAWPIPPDIGQVEEVSDEMTVQEFFSSFPVFIGVIGIGTILVASQLFWIGAMILSDSDKILVFTSGDIIIAGFFLVFTGWLFIGASVFEWFRRTPTVRQE